LQERRFNKLLIFSIIIINIRFKRLKLFKDSDFKNR
jgi:hypothetical protein